jgi:hypothetical protein
MAPSTVLLSSGRVVANPEVIRNWLYFRVEGYSPLSRRTRWRGSMRDVQSDDLMFGIGMQSHGKVALRLGK